MMSVRRRCAAERERQMRVKRYDLAYTVEGVPTVLGTVTAEVAERDGIARVLAVIADGGKAWSVAETPEQVQANEQILDAIMPASAVPPDDGTNDTLDADWRD